MKQLEILELALWAVAMKLQEATDEKERAELRVKMKELARLSVREELK